MPSGRDCAPRSRHDRARHTLTAPDTHPDRADARPDRADACPACPHHPVVGHRRPAQAHQERATWEARVLVRVGRHAATVSAEPPFRDEIGNCLPLEQFQGITLRSWVERYLSDAAAWPSLRSRLLMWERVARALHFAHSQGVVHRQLLPELISARTHLTSRTGRWCPPPLRHRPAGRAGLSGIARHHPQGHGSNRQRYPLVLFGGAPGRRLSNHLRNTPIPVPGCPSRCSCRYPSHDRPSRPTR